MNGKKILLVIIIVSLFIGVSYASEVNNNTPSTTDTPEIVKDTTSASMTDHNVKKEITKLKIEDKQTKTSTKSYNVTDYDSLHNALTTDTYDAVTISINSDIILTGNTELNTAIKTLTLSGNGKTMNGNNEYQFLTIDTDSIVTINNIKIVNCYNWENAGAIYNRGNLTLTECTLNNNHATIGGAIFNSETGKISITDSTLNNNTAWETAGAISNYGYINVTCTDINNNYAGADGSCGAIGNSGTIIITDCNINNNKAGDKYFTWDSGAIGNGGNMTIINTELNNNSAAYGGLISNWGTLTIMNSTLNNNEAYENGGAINNRGTLTITECNMNNNSVSMVGGAINNQGNITISNSNLKNNKAYAGGAIYNDGNLSIENSALNDNEAFPGGAIYNGKGNLIITNTTLNNNWAKQDCAAISNDGNLSITNSNLNNNSGGAIRNFAINNLIVVNNTFINNSANRGAAIISYNGSSLYDSDYITNTLIDGNYFVKNKANMTGNVIIDEGVNTIIKNNKYTDISQDSSTIHLINTTNTTITNNIFDDGREITTLTLNKISNTLEGEKIQIRGRLNADNMGLSSKTVTITLNNENVSVMTDSDGYYSYETTAAIIGRNNVTVLYEGDNNYSRSKNNTTFTVKRQSMIKHTAMANVEIGTTVQIVGRLVSNVTGQPIKYAQVTVKINNKTYQMKSNGAGYIKMNYTVNDFNKQKITFTYKGSSLNSACTNSTSFNVKQPTWIKMASMKNVKYGSTVKLVGRLLFNQSNAVKYVPVNVIVNDKTYKVKTNGAGYIRLNYTVNSYDIQKVTFKFAGNGLYSPSTNSTTFRVKQPTWIKMANMTNVKYGSKVQVVGRLLYNGSNPVKYVLVNITINGKVYNLKTDGAGYFRLNYTVNNYDNQKITFKFGGNTLYLASSNSTTFKVKQASEIKHANMSNVKVGTKVEFVGRLLYNGTNPVKYVPVKVNINGKIYQLKTDGAGYFRQNFTTTAAGIINITSNFDGNTLYLPSTNSTKFTVVKS